MNASHTEKVESELFNGLFVLAYLAAGTAGIALIVGWALKYFGPPKD